MIKRKLVVLRRISQTVFFLLFVYILWSTTYPLKGLLSPDLIFKIDPLVVFFTSLSGRIFLPGMILCLVLLGFTLVFGRFFCGWVCPLGTFNDWMGSFRKKKIVPGDRVNQKMRKVKYFVLGLIALFAVLGIQVAWVFDPLVMIARFVSLNFIPTVTLLIDRLFIGLIQGLYLYDGSVYDFYRGLKESVLGVQVYYFANAGIIFAYFFAVVLAGLVVARLWCRMLCPLGAIYCLTAKPALLERKVGDGCIDCDICRSNCRMGAIQDNMSYAKGECILCMDCVYDCPENQTGFSWRELTKKNKSHPSGGAGGITRGDFVLLLFSSLAWPGLGFGKKERRRKILSSGVIRPPGAPKGDEFWDRCIRCGNCMKVCPTNGLQPVMTEAGLGGIWTPQLVPEIGYCEYNCTLCGQVCPTGAIPRLPIEVKKKTKLGIAEVTKSICLAWTYHQECIVCEEHCPLPDKAVKLVADITGGRKIYKPSVDRGLCIGCGICQSVCPARPTRAIRVYPEEG